MRFLLFLVTLFWTGTIRATECPVCGMTTGQSSPFRFWWKGGQVTVTDTDNCLRSFAASPQSYLAGIVEKRSDHEAQCPVCGMPADRLTAVGVKGGQFVYVSSKAHAQELLVNATLYAGQRPSAQGNGSAVGGWCSSGSLMWPGFRFTYPSCTVLLFESFRLSSPGALFGACLLTVLLGIGLGALQATKRKLKTPRPVTEKLLSSFSASIKKVSSRVLASPWSWRIGDALLHAFTVGIGYILMLIAMTYNANLFISVLIGIALGHAIFAEPPKVKEEDEGTGDPCCSE